MRTKITKALATSTQSGRSDITIADTTVVGFELRIRPSGAKVWGYRYRNAQGGQRRVVLGRFPGLTVDEARQLAIQAAGDVSRGTDVQAKKRAARVDGIRAKRNTLGRFMTSKYEPWARSHLRSAAFQIARIKCDFADWFDKPLADLNTWLIEGWRKRRLEAGNKPITINRNLQRLQSVLSKAVLWKVVERHPFAGMKPLKSDRSGRVRYLAVDEETRLREAMVVLETERRQARDRFNDWKKVRGQEMLPPRAEEFVSHVRPMVLIAMNTGLRRGELFNLRWTDLDLQTKWLTVVGATSKNGQTRRIPLNDEAHEVLTEWHNQAGVVTRDVFVFPGQEGGRLTDIHKAWGTLVEKAGITNFRFHDLRHHFASRLVQSGVDLNTVRELLGHADIAMVLRYAHLSPGSLATAVEKLNRRPDPKSAEIGRFAPATVTVGRHAPATSA
jgi:integrase